MILASPAVKAALRDRAYYRDMYIPPEVVIVPAVFMTVAAAVITRMALRHREKMAQLERGRFDPDPEVAARLARMEQAIDSIAVEMERIGEGQRFLTKVLSDVKPRLPDTTT